MRWSRFHSAPLDAGFRRKVERAAPADIVEVVFEEATCGALTGAVQQLEKVEVGFQLARCREPFAEAAEMDAMDVQFAVGVLPGAARKTAVVDQLIGEIHAAEFCNQRRVERDLVQPVDDLRGRSRRGGAQ